MFLDQLFQAFLQHVGVDLGRGNVGVAQQLLDGAQIGAPIEQMARKGMAEHVRADPLGIETSGERQLLQLHRHRLTAEVALSAPGRPKPLGYEHGGDVRVALGTDFKIAVERIARRGVQGNKTLPAALAGDSEDARIAAQHAARQGDELADTHAGGVQDFE